MPVKRSRPTVAVLTMVRDEALWLPRWIEHYGGQFGHANLTVFDDGSTDGSTEGLPCPVHRLPEGWARERGFDASRTQLVNGVAAGLLTAYDVVIYTDADEFLVADPTRYPTLVDLLADRDEDVIAPVALNVVQHPAVEGPLAADQPVTEQREFAKFAALMCKPAVKRVPARWWYAGHGIARPYRVDPELFMLHLKFADREHLRDAAERRHGQYLAESSGAESTWARSPDDLLSRLEQHVDSVDPARVPEFDPAGRDLESFVRPAGDGRWYRSFGSVWGGLARQPLVRIPSGLRGTV